MIYDSTSDHPLMTVVEAAESLRLSKHTVHNWLSQGRLNRVKVGGRTFLKREEVQALLSKAMKS